MTNMHFLGYIWGGEVHYRSPPDPHSRWFHTSGQQFAYLVRYKGFVEEDVDEPRPLYFYL